MSVQIYLTDGPSMQDLVGLYNSLTGGALKKFESLKAARKRVGAAIVQWGGYQVAEGYRYDVSRDIAMAMFKEHPNLVAFLSDDDIADLKAANSKQEQSMDTTNKTEAEIEAEIEAEAETEVELEAETEAEVEAPKSAKGKKSAKANKEAVVRVRTPKPLDVVADDSPADPERETSGGYIQRMLLAGHNPVDIARLVVEQFPNRTTKIGDVYFNYAILKKAGHPDLKPWPLPQKTSASPPSDKPIGRRKKATATETTTETPASVEVTATAA